MPPTGSRLADVLVDLLAAVPSVVYGLWAFYFLIPKLKPAEQWFADTFHFIPFVATDNVAGPNYFIAGLVLAIMMLPIVSAISREVLSTVPADHKEAALALGATRWEMIRTAMLPYARRGIIGGAMLGLGRAIGETIAVTIVIGDNPILGHSIFDQGYSFAAVIANEFGEAAANPLHKSALIAAGLVLFVLTLLVNSIARLVVMRSERESGQPDRGAGRALDGGWLDFPPRQTANADQRPSSSRGQAARLMLWLATIVAIVPLILVIFYTLARASAHSALNSLPPIRPEISSVLRVASRARSSAQSRSSGSRRWSRSRSASASPST